METKFVITDNFIINETFQTAILSITEEKNWEFTDFDFMILGKLIPDILYLYPAKSIKLNYKTIYGIIYITIVDYYLDKKYPNLNLVHRVYNNQN